jgi:hypothetical protein
MPTSEELAAALMRAPPREAKVLSERLLANRSRAEAAAYWGIGLLAADVLVLRAGRALEAALEGAALAPPLAFGLEATEARALAGLEAPGPSVAPLAALLRELNAQREPVTAHWRRLQAEAERSPRQQAETWARRGAVLLVIGLTAFFYWREQTKGPQAPRYEPRIPIRSR